MYRRKSLCGCTAAAFGLGLLIGLLITSGFVQTLGGIILTGLGLFLLLK